MSDCSRDFTLTLGNGSVLGYHACDEAAAGELTQIARIAGLRAEKVPAGGPVISLETLESDEEVKIFASQGKAYLCRHLVLCIHAPSWQVTAAWGKQRTGTIKSLRWRSLLWRQFFLASFIPLLKERQVVLIHGALLIRNGFAAVVSGPSGIGKSTLVSRLAGRYECPADDCVLVCRDADGQYWAQEMPTWSIWYAGKGDPETTFSGCRSYPLKSMFLLDRGDSDAIYTIEPQQAFLGWNTAVHFMTAATCDRMPRMLAREIMVSTFDFSKKMSSELPIFGMVAPLDGKIWELLEKYF